MTRTSDPTFDADGALESAFGPLAVKMLTDTPLVDVWRVNFIANHFTVPIYRELGDLFGLSRPEFVILFCLSQKPGLAAKDICGATGRPKNSISRAVSDLLRKGLIEREARDEDRRSKTLIMTPAGQDLLDTVLPLVRHRQEAMLAPLSASERDQFVALLDKVVLGMPDWALTARGRELADAV